MIWGLADMPLAGARNRGGGGGPVLASELAGGEREVGERLEEIESYSKVVLDGVGDDRTELAAVAVGAAAGVDGGGGAPVREGG